MQVTTPTLRPKRPRVKNRCETGLHWNENVVILTKSSSLAALKVVKMTTFSAASDENFIKMTTFPFQCITYTVESLRKGQECLIEVAKFSPFLSTILHKSCLFYPSWQATTIERPSSWAAFTEGFHCICAINMAPFSNISAEPMPGANATVVFQRCEVTIMYTQNNASM